MSEAKRSIDRSIDALPDAATPAGMYFDFAS